MTEKLPYIVSADAEHLVGLWCKRRSLSVPDRGFFAEFQQGLAHEIQSSGSDFTVRIIPHNELAHGLQSLIFNHTQGDAVALDRAYVGDDFARHFEVTRAVDPRLRSIGTMRRPFAPPISQQLDYIVANSGNELTLVDDVIFSGDAIVDVATMFENRGAHVSTVLAAVAIGEGRKKIEDRGIEVVSVVDFQDVKDEICERDFLAGVPYSGRTVYTPDERHYSAPYILPFGDPEGWASIEGCHAAQKLSSYCVGQSIELWSRVEKLNHITLAHGDLPRQLELNPTSVGIVDYLIDKQARIK